jgi:pyruvate-formate lyase-activating enzyme
MNDYTIKTENNRKMLRDGEGREYDIKELVSARKVLQRLGYMYQHNKDQWIQTPCYNGEYDNLDRLKDIAKDMEEQLQDAKEEIQSLLEKRQTALDV